MSRTPAAHDVLNLPNMLTFGRIAAIPLICWLLLRDTPVASQVAFVLFVLAAITDWLDGWLARRQGLVSLTGKFLDPLADKLLVLAVFCCMLPTGELPVWFVIVALSREFAITALRALAAAEGLVLAADAGGKWKTAFQLTGLSLMMLRQTIVLPGGVELRSGAVGFGLLLVSLAWSLGSAWGYVRSFLQLVMRPPADRAAQQAPAR